MGLAWVVTVVKPVVMRLAGGGAGALGGTYCAVGTLQGRVVL